MGFVQELVSRQIANIDDAFSFSHLDDYKVFRSVFKHANESTPVVWECVNSKTIKAVPGDQALQSLDVIDIYLANIPIDEPSLDYPLAHLFILYRVTAILTGIAIKNILDFVPNISAEVAYWKDRQHSRPSTALYIAEVLPSKAFGFLKTRCVSSYVGIKEFWTDSVGSTPSSSEAELSSLFSSLQNKIRHPFSIFQFASNEIKEKLAKLESRYQLYAQQLGLLIRSSSATLSFNQESKEGIRALHNNIALLDCVVAGFKDDKLWNHRTLDSEKGIFTNLNIEIEIPALYSKVKSIVSCLQQCTEQHHLILSENSRSNIILRLWLPLSIAFTAVAIVHKSISVDDFSRFFSTSASQAWDTCSGFVVNWIIQPCKDMLATIRHREAKLAIMGTESLASDLDSLERMVVNFAKDHGTTDSLSLKAIAQRVRNGDLTTVLQHYEEDIRRPFSSALSGDLIRSLLIQIQKAKVDGELV